MLDCCWNDKLSITIFCHRFDGKNYKIKDVTISFRNLRYCFSFILTAFCPISLNFFFRFTVWGDQPAWNWLSQYWPIAGYWSSSSFRFYWPRRGQYTAILIEQAWSIKNLLYSQKDNIFLGTSARNPEPSWLANQNSGFVSSCPLARIQPYNNWTLSSRVNYSPEFFWLTCALICDRGVETFIKRIPIKNILSFKRFFILPKKASDTSTEIRPKERTRNISVHPIAFQVISVLYSKLLSINERFIIIYYIDTSLPFHSWSYVFSFFELSRELSQEIRKTNQQNIAFWIHLCRVVSQDLSGFGWGKEIRKTWWSLTELNHDNTWQILR